MHTTVLHMGLAALMLCCFIVVQQQRFGIDHRARFSQSEIAVLDNPVDYNNVIDTVGTPVIPCSIVVSMPFSEGKMSCLAADCRLIET